MRVSHLDQADELIGAVGPDTRINMLGIGVSSLNLDETIATLERWREERRRDYVCCVTVHGLVVSQRHPAVRNALNRAGLATMDGMPLVWWSQLAQSTKASRVCGPDLLEAMCARSATQRHRHFFYGSSPEVVEKLVATLKQRFPSLVVAGYISPPFRPLTAEEDAAEIAAINDAQPDYVWVGIGMPKQEQWMASHVGRIQAAALIGVGAAFDFHAGTKPRAPHWIQRTGFEWLFRLLSEPRRLAHRYIIDNAIFVANAVQQLTGLKSFPRNW